ncbi:hypothetical protein HZS_4663 [Henneguya salminicola]|nr:hypothetical protein HZS_4663 [Henneguya salminicola]
MKLKDQSYKLFLVFIFIKKNNIIQTYLTGEEHMGINEFLNYYDKNFIEKLNRTGRSQQLAYLILKNQFN